MFERLIDLILQFWNRIAPCEVVRVYEQAAVLRLGKYNRKLAPGLHWKIPVAEEFITVNTVITTMRLPPQSLTTKDDIGVVLESIIKYQITDVKPYVTEIWDPKDVLGDVSAGAVRKAVLDLTYKDLVEGDAEAKVLKKVREEVNKYGFKVWAFTFTDCARVRSIRLIQHQAKDYDN